MKKGALVLAVLLLVPLLPLAEAAGPEPRPWGSYSPGVEVFGVAFSRDGNTIASALGDAPAGPPGSVPTLPTPGTMRNDLAIVDYGFGIAHTFTTSAVAGGPRSIVAVSRDGLAIADLRRNIGVSDPAGADSSVTHIELHYARIQPGGNWSAGPSFVHSIDLGLATIVTPVGIVVSDDGRRVASIVMEGGNYVFRGHSFSGASFDSSFEIRKPGTARALVASGDLTRLVLAGQFVQGNFTYGGALVHAFAQADPLTSWFDTSANNTDVRGAALSRSGSTLLVGGADGRVHLFQNAQTALGTPASLSVGSGALGNLTLSEDGTRGASALGAGLTALDTSGAAPRVLWNTTVGGSNITGVSMNLTGGLFVVSSSGSGGGVFAYSDTDSTHLWSIPGDTRGVAIDSTGTRIAYALRTAVAAARIPRALTMDLVGGGKVAPTQTITVPGSTTFSVNLRNDGAALERVVFEENAPEITVSAPQGGIVSVRPGAIVRVDLAVNVSAGLLNARVFNVTARSISSGALDNVTLSVAPKPTLDVKLILNATDLLAQPGQPTDVLVTIVNNGTGDAPVVLRAAQTVSTGPEWGLSLSETQLTALRGTRTSVKVTITPPASVVNGTSASVAFTLSGQDIFDTARVSFRVNPELKVEVNATGVTKFIEPGKKAFYNVTVTNIGSLPRNFEVFYTIPSSDNRNWGVDMPSQTIRLDPLAKRTLPVTIVAPADVLPQERVAVLVSARSIPELVNESTVQDNVTLYGIAVELKITTTTTPNNGIPFMAPIAIVAAIAVLSVLLPRRRSQ